MWTPTALEWTANGATAVSVGLAARRNIWTWPLGILGCVLYAWLFVDSRLYADAILQVFFIVTSGMGRRLWAMSGSHGPALIDSVGFPRMSTPALLGIGVLVTALYGQLLKHLTDAYAPFWDSAVMASSVVAQILLMQGRQHTWPAWLLVNSLSVPLYISRDLYVTAGLYAAFWVNAWYGWWRWRRLDAWRQ